MLKNLLGTRYHIRPFGGMDKIHKGLGVLGIQKEKRILNTCMIALYRGEIQLLLYAEQFFYTMAYTHHQIGDDILDFVTKMLFLEYFFLIFVVGLFFDLCLFLLGERKGDAADFSPVFCSKG